MTFLEDAELAVDERWVRVLDLRPQDIVPDREYRYRWGDREGTLKFDVPMVTDPELLKQYTITSVRLT